MMRIAFCLLMAGSVALAGCGDDGGGGRIIVFLPVDAAPPPACDVLANTGCDAGEKCTFVYLDPDGAYGKTTCAADGTLDVGAECTQSAVGQADECKAGSFCLRGTCTEICSVDPDECAGGTICTRFSRLFRDQASDSVGLCTPTCEPVEQTCLNDEACYMRDLSGLASCSRVPDGALDKVQDEYCYGPGPGSCYLNGCAKGFDTFFIGPYCMQYCTPAPTGLDAVGGDRLDSLRGDPNGVQCGFYDPSAGDATNTECRYFNALITLEPGMIPPSSVGICLSQAVRESANLGSCTTHDLNAAYTQENIDNGTYVSGCESYLDQLGARQPAGANEQKRAFTEMVSSGAIAE